MALPKPLHKDHQVLGEEYCSGYMDTFGKWNNGFQCPPLEHNQPVYCCGTNNYKYCCTKGDTQVLVHGIPQLPLVLGVVFGVAVAVIVIVVVSCFHCSCCLLYKKRQPNNGGPLYQMHCPSAGSGMANMYSFSGATTPSDTPRSLSRSSSRSHGTVESGSNSNHHHPLDHSHLLEGIEEARVGLPSFTSSEPRGHSQRPASISERSSTISDGGPSFELPPPYCAQHSTLVAVRTAPTTAASTPTPRHCTTPTSSHTPSTPFIISGGGEEGYRSSPFATFPQTFLSPTSPPRPIAVRPPPPSFAHAIPPTTTTSTTTATIAARRCSSAHNSQIIQPHPHHRHSNTHQHHNQLNHNHNQNHHNHDHQFHQVGEDYLYTATQF